MYADPELLRERALADLSIQGRAAQPRAVEYGPEAKNAVRHEQASIGLGLIEAELGMVGGGARKRMPRLSRWRTVARLGAPCRAWANVDPVDI